MMMVSEEETLITVKCFWRVGGERCGGMMEDWWY